MKEHFGNMITGKTNLPVYYYCRHVGAKYIKFEIVEEIMFIGDQIKDVE